MLDPVGRVVPAAAVRARKSVVVAGAQGAGKTTLVRALCAEIPPHEAIGTFETEYELHLHELPDQHPIVHAWEARPGSGERGADGRQAGEFSFDEALYRLVPVQPVPPDRRRGPRPARYRDDQGDGVRRRVDLHHPRRRTRRRRCGKLVTCAMEAGAARHPRATPPEHRGEHRPGRPAAAGNHPAGRRRGAPRPVGVGDHRRHPGRAGEGLRHHPRLLAQTPAGVAVAGVLPDEYRELAAVRLRPARLLRRIQPRWRRDSAHPGAGRGAAGRRPDRHRRRAAPDPGTTSGAATSAGWGAWLAALGHPADPDAAPGRVWRSVCWWRC